MEPIQSLHSAARGKKAAGTKRWRPSRFNVRSRSDAGELLLFNTYSGKLLQVEEEQIPAVLEALSPKGAEGDPTVVAQALIDSGMLVDAEADEFRRARYQYEIQWKRKQAVTLIILPHENCNFRCTYCYEDFPRNKMEPSVRESLKKWVHNRCRTLKHLVVSWFGGEPLLAPDVIEELSASFMASCQEFGVKYQGVITTNGSLLTPANAEMLFKAEVRKFQITLDGPAETHDQKRKLAGGGGTFAKIYQNLLHLRSTNERFEVAVRTNFDRENTDAIPGYIQQLKRDFGGDARFKTHFHPVGQWGGANDDVLPICESREAHRKTMEFQNLSAEAGFGSWLTEMIEPAGSICYAADPNSFVVGTDGTVYKCTVALYNPRNQVGKMREDGYMVLDEDLFALWTTSDAGEDHECQKCFFRPSCQGAACPLIRIETGQRPCPPVKTQMKEALRIIAKEYAHTELVAHKELVADEALAPAGD